MEHRVKGRGILQNQALAVEVTEHLEIFADLLHHHIMGPERGKTLPGESVAGRTHR
jgi:hypothetical protein